MRLSFLSWVTPSIVFATCVAACYASGEAEVLGGGSAEASAAEYCGTLAACCATLPSEVVTSCNQLAAQAGASECAAELTVLATSGRCASPVTTTIDATTRVDATIAIDAGVGDGGAVACALLSACCGSSALPADQLVTCQSVQGAGVESPCASLLTDLTASNECAGGATSPAGACPALSACCGSESLPTASVTPCRATASAGVDGTCGALLTTLTSSGYCGGGALLPDGAHQPTVSCATLATCCNEITFPAKAVSECQDVASANVDGTCLSAYDGYLAVGYCE